MAFFHCCKESCQALLKKMERTGQYTAKQRALLVVLTYNQPARQLIFRILEYSLTWNNHLHVHNSFRKFPSLTPLIFSIQFFPLFLFREGGVLITRFLVSSWCGRVVTQVVPRSGRIAQGGLCVLPREAVHSFPKSGLARCIWKCQYTWKFH